MKSTRLSAGTLENTDNVIYIFWSGTSLSDIILDVSTNYFRETVTSRLAEAWAHNNITNITDNVRAVLPADA